MRLVSTGPPRNADTGLNNDSHRPLRTHGGSGSRHRFPGGGLAIAYSRVWYL